MRRAHMLRGTVVLLGALSLAACAPKPPAPSSGLPTSGIYKLGKPYQIDGIWHYPAHDDAYDETGIASLYGPDAAGKVMDNGEVHDPDALTAAHRTLPLPSLVRVTNLDNGRSIVVRVNDRGPASPGRVIGLSRRAAQLLAADGATAKVRVRILAEESRAVAAAARQGTPAPILAETDGPAPKAAPRGRVEVAEGSPAMGGISTAAVSATAPVPPPATVPGSMVDGRFLPAPVVAELPVGRRGRIHVQAGAFGGPENLARVRAKLAAIGQPPGAIHVTPATLGKQKLQRVRVGPFDGVERADAVLNQMLQAGLTDAKIVVD